MRTNAEESAEDELREDMAYLRKTWARIRELTRKRPAPSCLHTDLDLLQRVLRDFVHERAHHLGTAGEAFARRRSEAR